MKNIKLDQHTITPSKIICIGRNYVAHIQELGNETPDQMVIFLKPNSSITDTLLSQHPQDSCVQAIHYEGELCFMVKNNKLAAVAFGLDLTKRDLQNTLKAKGLPWERSKAFNGAALFSQFISINQVSDQLNFCLEIDGAVVQQADTDLMIYKPNLILQEVQKIFALEDGDIIMTGTPKGVGQVKTGQTFKGKIFQGEKLLMSGEWLAK